MGGGVVEGSWRAGGHVVDARWYGGRVVRDR